MAHWPITLDDAIRVVLHECADKTASIAFIADAINSRRLYVQQKGTPVFAEQIFLRARRYPDLFQVINRKTVKSLPAPRRKRVKA